jgi:filamentous hemagglutinin
LSPDQIVWLDSQIIDGVGMASEMFGRQTWGNRLSPLDNSAPAHTGGDQLPVELPRHTGNNSGQVNTGPNHTGNEENVPGVGPYNTGNTEGKPNTGSNITVTPIPDAPNKDDLAYLAKSKQSYQPNQGGVGNMGEFFGQAGFGSEMKGSSQKTTQIYQGQSVYQASGKVGEYIKKGDKYYLDGSHKNHLEVFDKRGNFRVVLNLDGSINETKTKEAEGRKLK